MVGREARHEPAPVVAQTAHRRRYRYGAGELRPLCMRPRGPGIIASSRLIHATRSRQVFRLLKAYRTEGPTGLISKRRGRRSNRRKPEPLRKVALAIEPQPSLDHP